MAGELNTEVRDDPTACRAVADWLGQLAPGVSQLGDSVYRQRGESESFWEGTAGQACRSELTRQGEDGDTEPFPLAGEGARLGGVGAGDR